MGIKVSIRLIILYLQPSQRISDLTGIRNLIPRTSFRVSMIGESRIECRCRIEGLLFIRQVIVFLQRTKQTHIQLETILKGLLRQIHLRRKILIRVVLHHLFPIHHTNRSPVIGCIRSASKSDMVILHDSQTSNLFGEIRLVT